MRHFLAHSLVVGIFCGGVWVALLIEPVVADDQALLQADRAFLEAVDKTDKAALSNLLDADFTWTDSDGNTQTRAQVLQDLPKLGAGDEGGAEVKSYTYAEVGVIEANRGKAHALRVWVKRPAGWREIVYQTVNSLDAPPSFTPGAGNNCENPCKSVPFKPKDEREREVIAAYEHLESAAVVHDAAKFSACVGEEFAAASSNGDKMFDKRTRMADFNRSKMGGVAPTPLVSARMFEFGNTVIMTSLHRPDRGRPLHVTRVWVKRDGKWVETVSYQTAIKSEPTRTGAQR
jgi:hypothetical protein